MITVLSLSPAVDKIYMIDDFSAGGLYRVGNCLQSPGGKGINVARVARMLEGDAAVLGFKAGGTGKWLEESTACTGARTFFIEVEGQSRTNNNIIDKVNNVETEILEEGPEISGDAWEAFWEVFCQEITASKVLVCSGGLPKGLGAETYSKLIKEANKLGVKTILDASGEILKQGISAEPYLIKPNLRELSEYFDMQFTTEAQILEACKGIINKGVKVVVTSMGAEGALLVSENTAYKAYPVDVNVINTIGSGDSMVAGISYGIAEGLPVKECFRLGAACAASNTEFVEIGLINTERVNVLKRELVIEEINVCK
ncbi:1-phosphofructokinase/tagatose 6-phosphate kinase [Ruminiclostridium sufflavum DSM 19573]|uniref:Tagatose-6-phosphate kinase n=1 Tax=Ruminiclostridium sufflavum DSM 19573 TaxID=1121337 RepID=A0A318XKV9_9FIRM|nr:1-phosphofructokinase family hexose kinase [Ruminiclostridium sufflavum]PYG88163.1 1-phosphofructokinase/tagatose 6-phosphate kinase [Ruminiclostridium sufflavum DSM 19573]